MYLPTHIFFDAENRRIGHGHPKERPRRMPRRIMGPRAGFLHSLHTYASREKTQAPCFFPRAVDGIPDGPGLWFYTVYTVYTPYSINRVKQAALDDGTRGSDRRRPDGNGKIKDRWTGMVGAGRIPFGVARAAGRPPGTRCTRPAAPARGGGLGHGRRDAP